MIRANLGWRIFHVPCLLFGSLPASLSLGPRQIAGREPYSGRTKYHTCKYLAAFPSLIPSLPKSEIFSQAPMCKSQRGGSCTEYGNQYARLYSTPDITWHRAALEQSSATSPPVGNINLDCLATLTPHSISKSLDCRVVSQSTGPAGLMCGCASSQHYLSICANNKELCWVGKACARR